MNTRRIKLMAMRPEELMMNFQYVDGYVKLPRFSLDGLKIESVAFEVGYNMFCFTVSHGSFPEVSIYDRPEIIEADYEVVNVQTGVCKWTNEVEPLCGPSDFWATSCGNTWVLIEGTPGENKMKYCPYCGRRLEVAEPAVDLLSGCDDDSLCRDLNDREKKCLIS